MDSYTFDLHRIFLGDVPLLFFLEILLRTTILYFWTLIMIRLTGKRSLSELTAMELLLVIGLGSAVGDPMFYPDVPVLHGMAVISIVVLLHNVTVYLTNRVDRVQDFVIGTPTRLVVDGVIDLDGLEDTHMSRQELFMELRQDGIMHLGQLQRVYIEPDGKFSLYRFGEGNAQPGMPIVPPEKIEPSAVYKAGGQAPETAIYTCQNCARPEMYQKNDTFHSCPRCENETWVLASRSGVPDERVP